jgi:hypothetical protein
LSLSGRFEWFAGRGVLGASVLGFRAASGSKPSGGCPLRSSFVGGLQGPALGAATSPGALRRGLRSRCPSRSSLGCGSLAFPAAHHGLGRSCFQGADLRGPNRGVGPGLSSRGRDPSWPLSKDDDILDTWSGLACSWAGLDPHPCPKAGHRIRSVQGIVDPSHRSTHPKVVGPAPCREPAWESCRTPLMDFSKIAPPSTSAARVHSRLWIVPAPPDGVQQAEAFW